MEFVKRSPRFNRVATRPVSFNEQDLEILRHVHRFRLLKTPHIVSLSGRGEKAIQRRLRLLYQHKYLDRIRPESFNDSIIHALGNRGADEISKHFKIRRERVDWQAKNRSLQRGYIDHTLMIGETMSWITELCRNESDLRVITQKNPSDRTDLFVMATTPFRGAWYNLKIFPDWTFSVTGPGSIERPDKFYYLECDRSTMPVATHLKRSSIEKKMSVYLASIRNGYHRDTFDQNNARVLWLIDSRYSGEKRLESLLEMNRQLTGGRGSRAFLFALREPLMKSPNARNAPVINGKGEQVSLID